MNSDYWAAVSSEGTVIIRQQIHVSEQLSLAAVSSEGTVLIVQQIDVREQ